MPYFKRYFLGGSRACAAGAVTKWRRSPKWPACRWPFGSRSLVRSAGASGGKLSAVAFVDAGGVGRSAWNVTGEGLRADVGPGLRYQTPVGPVRLDFGYQLTPIDGLVVKGEPETRHWRVHISIGQAF